jgi:hypothetical protein
MPARSPPSSIPIPRPVFVLRLRPEPACADPTRSLRAALKLLLRKFRLRCISIEERAEPAGPEGAS